MTDDEKQAGEPDPWADLDADAEGPAEEQTAEPAGGDEDAFIFDLLNEPLGDETQLADGHGTMADEGDGDASAAADVPLAVFPPHDADPVPPAAGPLTDPVPIESDRPEVISMNDVPDDDRLLEAAADEFDDAQLARELAFSDADVEQPDFGDGPGDPPSDDASFNADAFPAGETSPFADVGLGEAFPPQAESSVDAVESIPLASVAAAAATAAVTAAPRKKKSGIGQLIGVVLGGLAALPITWLIILGLMWGLQLDQLKGVSKLYPAAMLPQKFKAGPAKPAAVAKPKGPTLDDLPSATVESAADAAPATMVADTSPDGAEPADGGDPASKEPVPADDDPATGKVAAMKKADDEEAMVAAPVQGFVLPADVPVAVAEEFMAALAKLGTAEDVQAALTRLRDEPSPAPVAMPAEPPPVAMPLVEPPAAAPLDLAALETAVAGAAAALDDLEAVAEVDDPARKRLMVAWYRRLAKIGEQLSLLESVAADSGRPLEHAPEAVDGMFDRIRRSDIAIEDLRTLGRMWLATQKRRADGTVLVATVESSRPLGPYWSTRASIVGPDGTGRGIAVISRLQPAADIGDQILITGVLFDADTVWASDVRPLRGGTASDADLPAIGIPSTFEDPFDSLPAAKPPMLAEPEAAKVPGPAADAGDASPAGPESESDTKREKESEKEPAGASEPNANESGVGS